MAAPAAGIDALATLEAQFQQLFMVANDREQSLTEPLAIFTVAYDLEGKTATFSASGIPITTAVASGVLTINAAPIPTLP